ncbi:MAG: hypothetical protein ACREON_10395, partial [Gemmatimonadaceae bacterium]
SEGGSQQRHARVASPKLKHENVPACAQRGTTRSQMTEILFIEEAAEGGYIARSVEASIVTEADDLAHLRDAARDAVRCHFDEDDRPKAIRLHLVRDEIIAA